MLLSNDPRPAAPRLDDVIGPIAAVPAFLDRWLDVLTAPVTRWLQVERATLAGLPELFDTLETWAGLESPGQLPELRKARDFLAQNAARVEALRVRLVQRHGLPADTPALPLQEHLAKRYQVARPNGSMQDVLARYETERQRLRAFIVERDLFPLPPDEDMSIEQTPSHLRATIPAGAMWPPPPFRPGTRRSLAPLTLSEELLPQHTELSIPGMMLHEGIPGHHLQLAWAAELADEVRFTTQLDIARIGARVAIDLYLRSGERDFLQLGAQADLTSPDPFVAAGNLLAAVTGFVPGRAQAELNRMSAERGYPLSSLTGNHMLWELKQQVQAANEQRSTDRLQGLDLDRAFHRVFLQAGNMPLRSMRRVMQHQGLLPTG